MDVCVPLHVVSLRRAVQALRCVYTCVQGHLTRRCDIIAA